MNKYKDLMLKMLNEGKSFEEIMQSCKDLKLEADEKAPTAEEITKAFTEAEAEILKNKAFEGVIQTGKDQETQAEIDAKIKAGVDAELKKQGLPSVVDQGKAASPGGGDGYKFKSFMDKIRIIKDYSWNREMMKMLRLNAFGQQKEATAMALKFLEQSCMYTDAYKKELGEKVMRGDATTASYAVPDEFSDMVFAVAQAGSHCFANATKLVMDSDTLYLLGSGDATFTEITDQSTEMTVSDPTLTQDSITLIDAGAITYMHQNLIDDSNINMVELLSNAYGRGLARYTKQATTVNNVTTTGDKFNGIYSISGIGSVAVGDVAGGAMVNKDILNLIGLIDESYIDDLVFEMNFQELLALYDINDTLGRPLLKDPTGSIKDFMLKGIPVKWNNQMPATLATATSARTGSNTATILLYAPKEVQMGIKGGFEFDASPDFKFTHRQVTFRGFIRWIMDMKNTSAAARLTHIKRPS